MVSAVTQKQLYLNRLKQQDRTMQILSPVRFDQSMSRLIALSAPAISFLIHNHRSCIVLTCFSATNPISLYFWLLKKLLWWAIVVKAQLTQINVRSVVHYVISRKTSNKRRVSNKRRPPIDAGSLIDAQAVGTHIKPVHAHKTTL